MDMPLRCPTEHIICGEDMCLSVETLFDVAWHLNDAHRWTRERIADFVETVEQPVETPSTTLEAVCP